MTGVNTSEEAIAELSFRRGAEKPHVKALDGLRGVAILMVLSHHLFPYKAIGGAVGTAINGVFGLGWAGVNLFFVLSGFLITGILFDAREGPHYFRNFYARRTLRIFPLYYGMIIAATLLAPRLGLEEAAPSASPLWWWFYLSDVQYSFWPKVHTGWLNFFWSLAIEEHFYLVWPIVILLCDRRRAMRICVACLFISAASRAGFVWMGNISAPYLLTPCRIDALACGAWVALAARGPAGFDRMARVARHVGIVALILVIAVGFWRHCRAFDAKMQLIGLPLLDAVSVCALVLACAAPSSGWIGRILELPALRTAGKYSYGMYVLHAPIIVERTKILGPSFRPFPERYQAANDLLGSMILAAIIFGLAFASWHLYEKHFLRLKRYFEYSTKGALA